MREAVEMASPTSDYFAAPLEDNLFEWHFTVRGPEDTDFQVMKGQMNNDLLLPFPGRNIPRKNHCACRVPYEAAGHYFSHGKKGLIFSESLHSVNVCYSLTGDLRSVRRSASL